MSNFTDINFEYKLRVPLSSYADGIIEHDCMSFAKKRNTLINLVVLNFYRIAECSVSLRLADYKDELKRNLPKNEVKKNENLLDQIVAGRGRELKKHYAQKIQAATSKPVTLSKKVNELLTSDPESSEEKYYGNKPGLYLSALMEEYSRLPYYEREKIVFHDMLNELGTAIECNYPVKLFGSNGKTFLVKPFAIMSDPLSMYHYLIGISLDSKKESKTIVVRLSRITEIEIIYYQSGNITAREAESIRSEIKKKGVQFISNDESKIDVWLSVQGINKFQRQQHLRPMGTSDKKNPHIYHFECTEIQILYYFLPFGKDAKILSPDNLSKEFKSFYAEAAKAYK